MSGVVGDVSVLPQRHGLGRDGEEEGRDVVQATDAPAETAPPDVVATPGRRLACDHPSPLSVRDRTPPSSLP